MKTRKFNFLIWGVLTLAVLCTPGCSLFYGQVPRDELLSGLNLDLDKEGEQLQTAAAVIQSKSNDIDVQTESTKISEIGRRLIVEKHPKALAMEKHVQNLEKQVVANNTAKERKLQTIFLWMIILGIIGIVIGIAVIVVSKMALSGIGTAISLIGAGVSILGLGLYLFYWWIALIAMVGIAITAIGLFFWFWRNTNMLNDFAQNMDDIAKLSEKSKSLLVNKQYTKQQSLAKFNLFDQLFPKRTEPAPADPGKSGD